MNQNSSETSTRISSDINNNVMQLTISTVFLDKAAKAAAKQSKEQDFLQKKQDIKDSITNIIIILKIINAEMQYEQDQKTFTVLIQQKEIFEKILSQKQTGEKNSLRTIENEIISQLQNQIKNLKKSMKNKFNLILKTIESNQTQTQAQSQAQTQSQAENQSQIQSQTQSQNQTKTYAQVAAVNVEQNNLQQTKQQQKQKEKEKKKEKYREKRLIVQINKETAEDFDNYILRNKINDKFFAEANINQSIIATIIKSFTSQSIILTTMSDFSA